MAITSHQTAPRTGQKEGRNMKVSNATLALRIAVLNFAVKFLDGELDNLKAAAKAQVEGGKDQGEGWKLSVTPVISNRTDWKKVCAEVGVPQDAVDRNTKPVETVRVTATVSTVAFAKRCEQVTSLLADVTKHIVG